MARAFRLTSCRLTSGLSRLADAFARDGNVQLRELVAEYRKVESAVHEASEMSKGDPDPAVRDLACEELRAVELQRTALEGEMEQELQVAAVKLADDTNESSKTRSLFVEIRPGAGGTESVAFAEQLSAMYARFATRNRWSCQDLLNPSSSKRFLKISDSHSYGTVYYKMKHEAGVHRVQRVPESESTGRVHSSTVSVVVLAVPDSSKTKNIVLDPSEIRVDLFRASGAGGQHVNKTESAVRLTHIPTSISVSCQNNRSQLQNKDQAMRQLVAQLAARQEAEKVAESAAARRAQLGDVAGERSDRIRTYNFLQGRVTDHRVKGLSLHGPVERFLSSADGLEQLVEGLQEAYEAETLKRILENFESKGKLTYL